MDIKTRLYRYPGLMEEVQELQSQLDGLREQRYNTKITAVITGMPGGGQTGDPVFRSVEKIISDYDVKMAGIHERIVELNDEQFVISQALHSLDLDQRKVIELRCFERRRWKDIGHEVHFSRAQCSRLFDKAVVEMEAYLKNSNE